MTTNTLHDYDRLVATGVNEEQARVMVELFAESSRTSPEVAETLHKILARLDAIEEDTQEVKAQLLVIEQRMQSESRVQRMLNTTLIAIGALLGSLLAVFAR